MAWPAQKSTWRRRLNGRWLRWALWRAVFRVLPLAHGWSFPLSSVTASALATEKLDDVVSFANAGFAAGHGEILRRAERNDKIVGAADARRASLFRRQMAIIPRCAVLGHVGAVVSAADGRMLSLHGDEIRTGTRRGRDGWRRAPSMTGWSRISKAPGIISTYSPACCRC